MNWATQILENDKGWIPQIARKLTKRDAVDFSEGLKKLGVPSKVLKMTDIGWVEVNHG